MIFAIHSVKVHEKKTVEEYTIQFSVQNKSEHSSSDPVWKGKQYCTYKAGIYI